MYDEDHLKRPVARKKQDEPSASRLAADSVADPFVVPWIGEPPPISYTFCFRVLVDTHHVQASTYLTRISCARYVAVCPAGLGVVRARAATEALTGTLSGQPGVSDQRWRRESVTLNVIVPVIFAFGE